MIIANNDSGHLIVASADATADYFLLINPLSKISFRIFKMFFKVLLKLKTNNMQIQLITLLTINVLKLV